ncbi:hypothetical protein [Sulfurimonas sp.]|uniref:hypothetical protein n=1 Tax=Sulfurimonas sp. TaxID=2022749 RepID=UPI0025E0B39A|nr:hypothetical protein [Sulfurimonas sp.]
MYIYGHRFIESENFYHVTNIDAILNTPSNGAIYLDFSEDNLEIIKHTVSNEIILALGATTITEIIYASSLGASFIVVPKELSKTAQNIANNYLFDAKILIHITEEAEIEELAILGVDGVIFSNAIIKINS